MTNEKIVSKDWSEVIKKGEGVVFCFLMDYGRQKMNKRFKLAIDMTLEAFPEIKFDLNKGVKGDYLLCYVGEDLKAKKAPETKEKAPSKAKKTTSQKKKGD